MAKSTSTSLNGHPIPPLAMPLISPSALLHAHLTQNPPTRPSSRSPTQCRPIDLNTSSLTHSNGSSLVRIGDTAVVCGVRAEILPIHEIANYRVTTTSRSMETNSENTDSSKEAEAEAEYAQILSNHLLVPNLELSTGCSALHLPGGPPSSLAQSLTQRLFTLLHKSRLVSPSSLKIYYTPSSLDDDDDANDGDNFRDEDFSQTIQLKAYWTLYIDLLCISFGGSLFDAAWLAMCSALRDTVLPAAWWDANRQSVLCSPDLTRANNLTLNGSPVPLTWTVFVPEKRTLTALGSAGAGAGATGGLKRSGQQQQQQQQRAWILCDADAFEEECCEEGGTLTLDLNLHPDNGTQPRWDILRLEKSGGGSVGAKEVREVLFPLAQKRWREWMTVSQKVSLS